MRKVEKHGEHGMVLAQNCLFSGRFAPVGTLGIPALMLEGHVPKGVGVQVPPSALTQIIP